MRSRYDLKLITNSLRALKQCKLSRRLQQQQQQQQHPRGMACINRPGDGIVTRSVPQQSRSGNQTAIMEMGTNNNAGDSSSDTRPLPDNPTESCSNCIQDLGTVLEGDTEILSHQISGHSLGQSALLKHRLGYVLKLVQKPPLGQREVDFYRRVYENSEGESLHRELRDFIPRFYGVTKIDSVGEGGCASSKQYLILEDICQGFKHPCVVDVKIGTKTWDPLAPQAKIDHENSKYIGTKGPLGISVTGMQLYDIVEKKTSKRDKEFGKQLNVDNIHQAFAEFLNSKAGVHCFLAKKLLEQLQRLKKFFDAQKEYAFYSSSLLIAYDADKAETLVTNERYEDLAQGQQNLTSNDVIRVKMIDFAHAFPNNGEIDSNYMFGLENLIQILSSIAQS